MTDDVLSVGDVAELLGMHPKTIYRAAKRGQIPCRQVGRKLVFSRSAVLSWLHAADARPA
jgi:excisionase family DNA binding protein